MKEWCKAFGSAILVFSLMPLLVVGTCAQPVKTDGESPISDDTSRIAPSGVGTAGSAVAYPQKSMPGRTTKVKNQLDPGSPSQAELSAINRIYLKAEFSPRKAITSYVNKLAARMGPPVLQMARLQFLEHAAISATFKNSVFYSLKFPQWPISFDVPEPLQSNNVFVFDKAGKQLLIKSNDELEKLFGDRVHGIVDDQSARTATTAFLLLAQELAQDGMYQFSTTESQIKVARSAAGITTSGVASVTPVGGNSGEITVTLVFSPTGDIVSAQQAVNLKAGIRPICQSTKLLDRDPIVRRMAEQDLLIMGKAAKPYLDDQRKKVPPRLQQAIDEIWQRIQLEDR